MPRVLAQAFSKALIPPALINPEGRITGTYYDANNMAHGFLRDSNGTMITFDAPGAGTGSSQGTFPSSINPAGAITGYDYDANFLGHGFLRSSNGTFTTFDVPGLTSTFPSSISQAGAITGSYAYNNDVNSVGHGFLRASNGTLITFDAPGAGTGILQGTYPSSIN